MARYPSRSSTNTTPAQAAISPGLPRSSATRKISAPQQSPGANNGSTSTNKPLKRTGIKSHHFKNNKLGHTDEDKISQRSESSVPSIGDDGSGFESEEASAVSTPDDLTDEDDDYESEDSDAPPRKRQKPVPKGSNSRSTANANGKVQAKGQELWRQGVKAGLGPGRQVIIQKVKPRGAGSTPYKDDQIHPNTMLFLEELADNNDREWLKMHDPIYRQAWNDFTSFLECLQPKLIQWDVTIPELPVKDIIFRIYRDIRFSPDPTPYKTHFSAAWSRTGRKGPYAAYYLQIKPGGSFVGGGLWMPMAEPLAALRRNIDRQPTDIKAVLKLPAIRKDFLKNVQSDDKKVVKAFAAHNNSNALKTRPMGYEADHPDIELLRLRNYTIGRSLSDEEVTGSKGIENIAKLFKSLVPFVTYLNDVVMPD